RCWSRRRSRRHRDRRRRRRKRATGNIRTRGRRGNRARLSRSDLGRIRRDRATTRGGRSVSRRGGRPGGRPALQKLGHGAGSTARRDGAGHDVGAEPRRNDGARRCGPLDKNHCSDKCGRQNYSIFQRLYPHTTFALSPHLKPVLTGKLGSSGYERNPQGGQNRCFSPRTGGEIGYRCPPYGGPKQQTEATSASLLNELSGSAISPTWDDLFCARRQSCPKRNKSRG
ncbi:MAG: hypothetical protein QOD50_1951, partial [Actinomycetota bacterium]|nr:hypothetical protein [Actinomycetota bacterium]